MWFSNLPDGAMAWSDPIVGLDRFHYVNSVFQFDAASPGAVEVYVARHVGTLRVANGVIDTRSSGSESDPMKVDNAASQLSFPLTVFDVAGLEQRQATIFEPSADITILVRNLTGAAFGQYGDFQFHLPFQEVAMALTNAQLQSLKTELENDPNNYGYDNGETPDDAGDADKLNQTRPQIRIKRRGVSTRDVWAQVQAAEYGNLSDADKAYIGAMMNLDTVDFGVNGNAATQTMLSLQGMFPAASTNTGVGLEAIYTEDGSVAQDLLGSEAPTITPSDVASARNLP